MGRRSDNTGTCAADGRRRSQRGVGRGVGTTLAVAGLLAVLAVFAAGASAAPKATSLGAPSMATLEASGVRELPADAGPARRGMIQSESLPPIVPGVLATPSGERGAASDSTIFYDGFEGSVASWTVAGGSLPTWAFFTYRPFAGEWSGYCAGDTGSSYNYPPGPYFNNMNAWLAAGPFDLSGVTSATFSFKLWLDSELNYDGIFYGVSIDGQHYYGPGALSGNSGGWIDRSIDLRNVPTLGNVCGRSRVWIAYVFTSDASNTDEGAYVDEVRITGSGSSGVAALSLFASAQTIPYNGTVTLSGTLTDASSGALLPGREIDWWWSQSYEIPMRWTDGGAVSVGTGAYALGIRNIVRRTYFITSFAGDSQYPDGCWSDDFVEVTPYARLAPPAVPSRVRAGKLTTSWGTLLPRHTAEQNRSSHTKVYAQRYSGGRWRPVIALYAQAYRNTSSATLYRFGLRYASGRWRVRAVHQDSDHAKTTSSWRTFTAY